MRNERGMVLVFVLLSILLLSALGLALAVAGIDEFRVSNEYERHQKALQIADSGLNLAKNSLRGMSFTTAVSDTTEVPQYIEAYDPPDSTPVFHHGWSM